MTSSFPARAGLLFACLLLAACPGTREERPPDTPRQRVDTPTPEPRPGTGYAQEPVELRSVSARPVEGDTALARLAGRAFLERATDPIAIEVQTERPLGELARNAIPLVYLNGERIEDTRPVDADLLVAFLPDRTMIRPENRVAVAWVGSVQATMTRQPLTLRAEDIRR